MLASSPRSAEPTRSLDLAEAPNDLAEAPKPSIPDRRRIGDEKAERFECPAQALGGRPVAEVQGEPRPGLRAARPAALGAAHTAA